MISAAAALLGCGLFGPDSAYTARVDKAAIDAAGASYVASMSAAGNRAGFWIADDPVETINVADNATRSYRVRQKAAYHTFAAQYPWDAKFRIEPLSDAHAIVVQTRSCTLFETYDTTFSGDVLSAYSGAVWNLRRPFLPLPPGNPSAMASGLSLYAGMIRWEEVASGNVDHALNWAAPAGTVSQWGFVRPASDTDGVAFKGSSSYQLPYGAHLRLRASFNTSSFGPQSAAIARAMKLYGVYLADTAHTNELYNAIPLDGRRHWDGGDLRALESIHITDFDVLALPPRQRVPGH